jgi:PAS domain S-box-containing protein
MALPRIYFEKLLESSPDIVVAVDREGSIVFYNDGARQTLGYTSAEMRGQPVAMIYASLDEAKRVMHAMRGEEYVERGKVKNFETIFTAKGGEQIPVAISGSIIYDDQGNETGSIGFAKDLRAIRHHDQLITLGEIAVSLAHEINNPLEVITNTLELVEGFVRRVSSDEQMVVEEERFETLERELGKIHRIVSRVQEMAEGGTYETRQYLPGTLMTDLRVHDAVQDARGATVGTNIVFQPRPAAASPPPAAVGAGRDGDGTLRPGAEPTVTVRPGKPIPAPAPVVGPLSGLTILVVDDDLGICQSMSELLRSHGSEVAFAICAADALALIGARRFDLVVSDVVMPDMDGYDLYMELKETRPELPVILMTGYLYDRDHVIKRSKLAGLDGKVLYKKPIDPERLKAIILERCKRAPQKEGDRHGGGRESGRNPPVP